MSTTTHAQDLIDVALAHLDQAAQVAAPGLAAQIRLAAATLTGAPSRDIDSTLGLTDHLAAALSALDAIAPLAGPADLQLSAWHIHELRRLALTHTAA